MRAIFSLMRQNIKDLLLESAPWRKIIHGARRQSGAAGATACPYLLCFERSRTTNLPGSLAQKQSLLYIEETPTVITAGEIDSGPTTALPQPAMVASYYI